MIIVTCRVYPKGVGPAYKTDKTYKEKSYAFDNCHQLKDFLDGELDVIVDKVFEIKEEKQVSSCQINRIENESFGNGIQNLHAAAIRQRLKQSEADIKAMSESETGRDQEDNHEEG